MFKYFDLKAAIKQHLRAIAFAISPFAISVDIRKTTDIYCEWLERILDSNLLSIQKVERQQISPLPIRNGIQKPLPLNRTLFSVKIKMVANQSYHRHGIHFFIHCCCCNCYGCYREHLFRFDAGARIKRCQIVNRCSASCVYICTSRAYVSVISALINTKSLTFNRIFCLL